jgi:rare lipoprotein A (RlpA)-like double-psi beta-barrel protein
MSLALLERQAALAAVALVAALASLALTRGDGTPASSSSSTAPGVPAVGPEQWFDARVGTYGPGLYGQTTACGQRLTQSLEGVAHGVLPCGARIVVAFGGREVETRVVDRGPKGTGQEFTLTEALAGKLGMSGIQAIRWRFSSGR